MARFLSVIMALFSVPQIFRSVSGFVPAYSKTSLPRSTDKITWASATIQQRLSSSDSTADSPADSSSIEEDTTGNISAKPAWDEETIIPPWNRDIDLKAKTSRNNSQRLRQHVNPLARKFQQQTILSDDWPQDVYADCKAKPLALDIGAGKGGFLLTLASQRPTEFNYLGLEIRPLAVKLAQDRLQNNPDNQIPCQGHLDFVGCNANVDLGRLLSLYEKASNEVPLELVTIQFPDPHFKSSQRKRRVVTPELVNTLPAFMPSGAKVFLQSDIQEVLDDMRERFREAPTFFQDQVDDVEEYYPENIIGIPTEREVSVLEKGLPVYRALFIRTDAPATKSQWVPIGDRKSVV